MAAMIGDREAARRLEQALEMHDDGVAMMRENLRRKHPVASEEEIDELLGQWLAIRPGAELGDGEGQPGEWPRSR